MKSALPIAVLAAPAILCARTETGFLNRTVRVGPESYKYQVYLPDHWTKRDRLPVILFLHGGGERGQNGLSQTQVGLGGGVRFFPERYPAIIVMPQCRPDMRWTQPEMQAVALAALEAGIREFKGDRTRVYLTGLSLGGYGTLSIASRHAQLFAAIAPVCGGIVYQRRNDRPPAEPPPPGDPYADTAARIAKIPIWLFHGAADPVVPVSESQKMVEALKAAGAQPKYTEYPGVGHNSWDKAYADPDFPKWLFGQKLAAPPKKTAK
ncbi:MAG: hypothetical protein FJW40_16040 [Acidobacteria bacterium]|nr:hypothetical protein [Acidobacteriota bacterium]